MFVKREQWKNKVSTLRYEEEAIRKFRLSKRKEITKNKQKLMVGKVGMILFNGLIKYGPLR